MQSPPPHSRRETSWAAVWAPWLAAPLFAALPIGGCGVAEGFRPAAAQPPAAPTTTARTAGVAGLPGLPVRVVRVVPAAIRDVAWGPTAD